MQVSKKREIASADAAKRAKVSLDVSTVVRYKFCNGTLHRLKRGGFPVSTIFPPIKLNLASAISCTLPAMSIFDELFIEVAPFFKNLIQILLRVMHK